MTWRKRKKSRKKPYKLSYKLRRIIKRISPERTKSLIGADVLLLSGYDIDALKRCCQDIQVQGDRISIAAKTLNKMLRQQEPEREESRNNRGLEELLPCDSYSGLLGQGLGLTVANLLLFPAFYGKLPLSLQAGPPEGAAIRIQGGNRYVDRDINMLPAI